MNHLIDNNGDKLYTIFYPNPNKETVILLHGGPGFPSDLIETVELLKDSFQIITFHQRGTKKSPCVSNNYSMDAYISDIETIRKHFGIDKFHLWGHSWGGLYAQIYAEKYADNLLSLFLCSPGSGTNLEWKQTEKEVMEYNKSACTSCEWTKMGINSLLGLLGSHSAYKRLFEQVMINYHRKFLETPILDVDLDNIETKPIYKTRPEIIKYPLLKKQTNPFFKITVEYGDNDLYKTSMEFVINRYPTAKIITINHCGHIPWLHNPLEYNKIVKNHYK